MLLRRCLPAALQERKQLGVDLVLVRGAHAVRRAGNNFQRGALDQLRRKQRRIGDGHDLIVVAVQDQGGDVDLLEVFGEIRFGEGLDAVVGGLQPAHHPLQPEGIAQALRDFRVWPVGAVEGHAQVLEKLRAVRMHAGANVVEGFHGQAAGIGGRLQHDGRHGADEHGLGDTLRAVASDVARDFAAAGGVAHVNRLAQIELLDQFRDVGGVGVHLVAFPGLAGAAVAAPVMRHAAVTAIGEEHHLIFPGVRAERPAVAENHRLPFAPIFVINLSAVLDGNCRHVRSPFLDSASSFESPMDPSPSFKKKGDLPPVHAILCYLTEILI